MIHTVTVSLAPSDVLARAQQFFAERVPNAAHSWRSQVPRS